MRYDEFIREGKGEGHRQEFHSGPRESRLLGDDRFVEEVLKRTDQDDNKSVSLNEVIDRVGKLYDLTEEEIVSGGKQRCPAEARGLIAYLVRESRGLSLTDLGKRLKRDQCSLSLAAERIVRRSKNDVELGKKKKTMERFFL